jgi:hypothetical protein
MVFSVTFVPRYNKQNSFNSESAVGQLPTDKNVSKGAEDIFGFVLRQRLVKTQQTGKNLYVL